MRRGALALLILLGPVVAGAQGAKPLAAPELTAAYAEVARLQALVIALRQAREAHDEVLGRCLTAQAQTAGTVERLTKKIADMEKMAAPQ